MAEFSAQYTTTGAKDEVVFGKKERFSALVLSENGDATYTIEGKLGSTWHKISGTVNDGEIFSSLGPVPSIRLNISNLGTSTTVDFKVFSE